MKRSASPAMAALAGLALIAGCERSDEMQTKDVALVQPFPEPEVVTDDHGGHIDDQAASPAEGARLEAHVHGTATLAITMDGNVLTAIFEAPLMSMVGFEHDPRTDAERERVQAVVDAYTVPLGMVDINRDAGCLPQTTTSGTHIADGHGSLEVEHVYTCDKPRDINRIDFLLLEGYPDLTRIDAIFLSDTRQVAKTLTQTDHTLDLD